MAESVISVREPALLPPHPNEFRDFKVVLCTWRSKSQFLNIIIIVKMASSPKAWIFRMVNCNQKNRINPLKNVSGDITIMWLHAIITRIEWFGVLKIFWNIPQIPETPYAKLLESLVISFRSQILSFSSPPPNYV